ncbi:MAG: MopE-related protein [bacterium]
MSGAETSLRRLPSRGVVLWVVLVGSGCVELFEAPTPRGDGGADAARTPADTGEDRPSSDAAIGDDGGAAEPDAMGDVPCLPREETCDGTDEDCDGRIDEGITAPACDRPGVCAALGVSCAGAAGWVCGDPGALPGYEADEGRCDGLDNDCDGAVDERQGAGQGCTVGVGACQQPGVMVCAGPDAAACDAVAGEPAAAEDCNGIDDDCDGTVDEPPPGAGWDPRLTGRCQVAIQGRGVRTGVVVCAADRQGVACRVDETAEEPEACDGLDNDGDEQVDEGCETVQVAVGSDHACSRQQDGAVHCWGEDEVGQLRETPDGRFSDISAGYKVTCGIRVGGPDDGGVAPGAGQCWGLQEILRADGPLVDISAGHDGGHCVVRGGGRAGEVACSGDEPVGDLEPDGRAYQQISRGDHYACAVRRDGGQRPDGRFHGGLDCWGREDRLEARTAPDGQFIAVAAGTHHACALGVDDRLYCWGLAGRIAGRPGGAFPFLPPHAGITHTCAIGADGQTVCWGSGSDPYVYAALPDAFSALSIGESATCGLREGVIDCWGGRAYGTLDVPSARFDRLSVGMGAPYVCGRRAPAPGESADEPREVECWGQTTDAQVPFPAPMMAFSAGHRHLCGLDAAGELHCTGYGGLADVALPAGPFAEIECGYGWCCALRRPAEAGMGGALACWVAEGQEPAIAWRAYEVAGAFDAVRLATNVGCARGLDGRLTCFARGGGAPPAAWWLRATPVLDFDLTPSQICAIEDDGTSETDGVWRCWGDNREFIGRFQAVTSGSGGTCAIHADGTLRCWSGADSTFLAPPEGTFTAVEVGGSFACALGTDGRVRCWGGIH